MLVYQRVCKGVQISQDLEIKAPSLPAERSIEMIFAALSGRFGISWWKPSNTKWWENDLCGSSQWGNGPYDPSCMSSPTSHASSDCQGLLWGVKGIRASHFPVSKLSKLRQPYPHYQNQGELWASFNIINFLLTFLELFIFWLEKSSSCKVWVTQS